MVEETGSDEEPLFVARHQNGASIDDGGGASSNGGIDVAEDGRSVHGADERAHLRCGIAGWSGHEGSSSAGQLLDEGITDGIDGDDHRDGHAALTR